MHLRFITVKLQTFENEKKKKRLKSGKKAVYLQRNSRLITMSEESRIALLCQRKEMPG